MLTTQDLLAIRARLDKAPGRSTVLMSSDPLALLVHASAQYCIFFNPGSLSCPLTCLDRVELTGQWAAPAGDSSCPTALTSRPSVAVGPTGPPGTAGTSGMPSYAQCVAVLALFALVMICHLFPSLPLSPSPISDHLLILFVLICQMVESDSDRAEDQLARLDPL